MYILEANSYIRGLLNRFHAYHLLNPSIWPLLVSGAVLSMVIALVSSFFIGCVSGSDKLDHLFAFTIDSSLFISVLLLCYIAFCWWSDVSSESGEHTENTIHGLKIGMVLFIASEVMFFFSFFWSLFHFSISPASELGSIWPPVGFENMVLSYQKVPLLNTLLLLASGVSVTYAHSALHTNFHNEERSTIPTSISDLSEFVLSSYSIKFNSLKGLYRGIYGMIVTLVFAFLFIILQVSEYLEAIFNISDGTYGSTFFVMTGFHGLHVIIGTVFLIICLYRICDSRFFAKSSTGLECAIWYWHFVDVVWLFLYISIYWWGNITTFDQYYHEFFLDNTILCDCPTRIYNIAFQHSATNFMEEIVALYHYVYLYLVFITFVLLFIILDIFYHR
jgi:cytochrome c oxidase subunit 3